VPNSRYYSSIAAATNLQVTANTGDTSIQVASSSGWPGSFPFIVSLDYGSANEELVLATSGGPNTFSVTRAYDGTSASTHNAGAVVRHVSSAIDFTDSRTHEASTTGVHGVTGQFVDTSSVQTLSNKTLNSSTLNAPSIVNPAISSGGSLSGTFTGNPILSGAVTFTGTPSLVGTSLLVERTLATDNAYRARLTGDANSRYVVNADGKILWGPGTGASDVNLARTGIGVLTLTGALTITGVTTLSGGGTLTGNFAGNPAFTGTPTFTPTTAVDGAIIGNVVPNGWSLDSAAGRKAAGVTTIKVDVERVGANISSDASGNVADFQIGTLVAGWRPIDGTMITNYDMSGRATGSISIGNDGICTVKSLSAGNTIGLADTIHFSLTFVSAT
jgi:hypothetical protein